MVSNTLSPRVQNLNPLSRKQHNKKLVLKVKGLEAWEHMGSMGVRKHLVREGKIVR